MSTNPNAPRAVPDTKPAQPMHKPFPDVRQGREGGDDALTESSPTDSRSDEKVIVNEQRGAKTVNVPSQTASNTSEVFGNDDEIIGDRS